MLFKDFDKIEKMRILLSIRGWNKNQKGCLVDKTIERYEKFEEMYPNLVQRVPQKSYNSVIF